MPTVKPTRRFAALLGFLLKAEVDAIFKQQPFEPSTAVTDPTLLWRASCEAIRALPATPQGVIEPLDEEKPVISEIKSRRTFREYYEAIADYHFCLAPVEALLSPQWNADLDYVDELAQTVSPDATLDDLLRVAMPESTITEPMIAGNQVIFSSPRRDLHADQVPKVREVQPGEFEISVRASSRPNYIQVASVGQRLLLTNGVHKVCALFKRGYKRVPCVFRVAGNIQEAGLNPQLTSMFRPDLLNSARPAQVVDFLNDAVAVPLKMRSLYQVLKVGVGVELSAVPAVVAGSLL